MKKIISSAAFAAIISIVCLSCTSNKNIVESTVNKIINMAVFTSSDYTAKVYEGTTASLSITVKKASSGTNVVVLEKSFPSMPLQYFPDAVNAFKDSIEIAGVKSQEALQISYTLIYNSNGSVMQMQGDEVITGTQKSGVIKINI